MRIGAEAFLNCFRLKTLVLPEGLTAIGDRAFSGCGVRSMTLPASLEDISLFDVFPRESVLIVTPGSFAEQYCKNLELNWRYA